MRTSEYERRRLALEKQYQEDLVLLRDAHHARLRARSRCSGSVRLFQAEGPAVKSFGTQTESGTQN